MLDLYNNNGLLDPSTQVCASAYALEVTRVQLSICKETARTEYARVQVCLLQYPLRPPWRPYDRDYSRPVCSVHWTKVDTLSVPPLLFTASYHTSCMQVQFKPQAKRMQMEVPLNKNSAEYNADADPSAQLETIRLDSTVVDMRTTHAVLTIRQACSSHADW